MKKALLVISSKDFQPIEYGMTKRILEENGTLVYTASDKVGIAKAAYTNDKAEVDILLEDARAADYDGVFFIGGPGAMDCLDNEKSYKILREASFAGKAFGAICISTRILANAGVLKNKKAAGWNGDNELDKILYAAGAEYMREPVVKDGKIITADGPKSAEAWGKEILKIL
ncbi:MAG: DJ-1/PfpI family protein [Patescibacteria group bacterium]|jgi:putative intracellular protease/amidase